MLRPSDTVGRYRIEELVGTGGMASVFRARHLDLGSVHALKIIAVGTASVRDRFLREGRTQARLGHDNIVAVTDVLDHQGNPVLVMDFIAGPPLDLWLRETRPGLRTAVDILAGIARGVRHAHQEGVIHRDLKPANILLHVDEGRMIPKVADFGLVKTARGSMDGGRATTRSGVALGTPEFMAPEQIRDASRVDERADIFSLGCILYTLVCGRPPFQGNDMLAVFNAIAKGRYPRPRTLAPEIPDSMEELLDDMLAVHREDRLPSCDALLARLEDTALVVPSQRGPIAPALALKEMRARHGSPLLRRANVAGSWLLRALPLIGVPIASVALASAVVLGVERNEPVGTAVPVPQERPKAKTKQKPTPVPVPKVKKKGKKATPKPRPERPRPVRPRPKPGGSDPVPKAKTAPEPSPGGSRVSVSGDAKGVWLVKDGTRIKLPASVWPGTYTIEADFGSGVVSGGRVDVQESRPVSLRCSSFVMQCVKN